MGQYASNTDVPSDRSRNEIERTLKRYGADDFAYASRRDQALIGFVAHGRQIRFVLPLPDRDERRFTHHSRGARTASAAEAEYEQVVRQKWRALALVIKAKLEAVESGITEFEAEFYAHTVLPGGQTVYEATREQVDVAITTGTVMPLIAIESGR